MRCGGVEHAVLRDVSDPLSVAAISYTCNLFLVGTVRSNTTRGIRHLRFIKIKFVNVVLKFHIQGRFVAPSKMTFSHAARR